MRHAQQVLCDLTTQPLLIFNESDASSHEAAFRKSFGKSLSGSTLQRSHHDQCEFLSERIWMATQLNGREIGKSQVLIRPAKLLRFGKTSAVHIRAMNQSIPLPFADGSARSIRISSYWWDRAAFSSCFRLAQQQAENWWHNLGSALYEDWVDIARCLDVQVGATTIGGAWAEGT